MLASDLYRLYKARHVKFRVAVTRPLSFHNNPYPWAAVREFAFTLGSLIV
jgi:hypothetical protein